MATKKKDVEVTGRADASGVPISAVGWSDENQAVKIGGNSIEATSTPDNKAVADSDEVDSAIADYKQTTGIKSGAELNETYHKYDDDKDTLTDKIVNRDDFVYDPNEDASYLAYKEQYTRNAQKSFEDILARYMARSGGMLNSAAQTQATVGYNEQMQALNDKIPELEQNAFNEYQAQDEMNKEALEKVNERAEDDYNTEKESSDTAVNLADKNADRQQTRTDNAFKNAESETDAKYYEAEKQADLDATKADTNSTKASTKLKAQYLDQAIYDYYIEKGKNRGYFTKSEATFLGVDPDTSPYDMENRYFENVTLPQYEAEATINGYNQYKAKYGGY